MNIRAVFVPVVYLFALNITSANAQQLTVDSAEWVLNAPACSNQNASWVQTSGPTSAIIAEPVPVTNVLIQEYGDYGFELTCCAVEIMDDTNRVQVLLSSPDRVGFGAPTTGGAEARQHTVVTSLADDGYGTLREALRAEGPRWIVFDDSVHGGTIRLRSTIRVNEPDFTIDGRGANITISPAENRAFPMLVFRGGNGIVQGITLDGLGTRSTSMLIREGDYYWVDHVTIKNNIYDDAIGIGQGSKGETSASEITISNYHAHNTQYAILGGGENEIRDYPPYRVTIHSSNMSAQDRNPRIKNYGTAHVFNNYIHSFKYTGLNAGANSIVYSENNIFSALSANNPTSAQSANTSNGGSSGIVYSSGDVFIDVASNRGEIRPIVSASNLLPYDYTLMMEAEILDHVLASAGANGAYKDGASCETHTVVFSHNP